MKHISVLLDEVLEAVESLESTELIRIADLTAGAGGHFFSILERHSNATGICVDRDPDAFDRLKITASKKGIHKDRWEFVASEFSAALNNRDDEFDFILADLGISSFQIDDPQRGMSIKSQQEPDFRMNPNSGQSFSDWLGAQSMNDLEFIFEEYAEEPRAQKLASAIKNISADQIGSAEKLAQYIKASLGYANSKKHPAIRVFQAFRIAINDELGELKKMLSWAPKKLKSGGVLAIISFHSVEDRIVKNTFKTLATSGSFDILYKKPLVPGVEELQQNPRSRSAKLRLLKKGYDQ